MNLISDILNTASKQAAESGAGDDDPIQIPLDKIIPSKKNMYGMRGIDELADDIEINGLYHNLVVKIMPGGDNYELISGERRYRALKLLVERGITRYSRALCKVETEQDETLTELKLIMANLTARELSASEKTNQANRLFKVLQELKEKGAKLSGRRREIVAKMLNVSAAQVGRMEHINKNLIPGAKEEFEKGNLDMTAAYEASRLPAEKQEQLVEDIRQGAKVDVKAVKKKSDKSVPPPKSAPIKPSAPPELEATQKPLHNELELKSCPFCGGSASRSFAGIRYMIFCVDCKAQIPPCISREDAYNAWNRRHSG